jgi:hypothetical protein
MLGELDWIRTGLGGFWGDGAWEEYGFELELWAGEN